MIQLNEKYNREDFLDFLNNDFLSDFEKDVRPAYSEGLAVITKAAYLGKSKSLDLHIFEFSYSESHANKRVALAMDGFRIMKSTATFNALIIFNPANKNKWRLSLMTATPAKNEKGGVSVHLSNPRRYSFELGENTKINTPFNFLIKKGKISNLDDLKKRFSIEVVNKEFYAQISELFTELVGGTRGEGRNQRKYPGIIALPSVPRESRENHEFAVRLIGRLIFCWFLREKKSITDLPLISKDILSLEAANNNPDYYHSVLEPLFFEVLNKPTKSRIEEYRNSFFGKTPYLNGGLFTPQAWDYYDSKLRSVLKISDEWIRKLFEVLELYNFTVDENTSIDIDLSIDPEMLGRIFENLLAEINPETGETARKSTGSYYTPRTIVDYMVDESLIQYLKDKTGIDEDKLRVLVSYDLSDDEDYPLNEDEKDKVVESLSKITILDPACGSGAFPIGALQKIVFILQRIDQDAKLWFKQQIESSAPEIKRIIEREFAERNFDYIRKLGIIRQSIFGVDIQPIATEIARLRCFLTLVVDERVNDEEENRGIEPLPNLDFKFVTANSLIGLPSSQANSQVGLFEDQGGINKLKEVRDMYFNASGTEREQLKLQFVQIQNKMFQKMIQEHTLADLTQKLSSWNPFGHDASDWFNPDWMFGVKEGFDIVIANPPYIQIKQIPWDDRKIYKQQFKSAVGRFNIFYFFIDLSATLTKKNGISAFIIPDRLLLNTQCSGLRLWLLKDQEIIEIDSFEEGVFESAIVDSILLFFRDFRSNYSHIKVKDKINLENLYNTRSKTIPISYFSESPNQQFDLSYDPRTSQLIKIIRDKSIVLGDISDIKDGIIQGKIADELFLKIPRDSDSKPLLFGENIGKYFMNFNNNWINYKPVEMMKLEVKRRGVGVRYGLWLRTPQIFEREKILTRQTADEIIATYDTNNYYYSNTLHGTTITNKNYNPYFILALLNSRLITWYYRKTTAEEGKVFAQIKIALLRMLPIFNGDVEVQKPLIECVNKIFDLTNSEDYSQNDDKQSQVKEYEKRINQLVYKLYGLTPEEIAIVEDQK